MLCFKSVRPEHAGEIRFTAERVSSYATLTVKGEPAAFSNSRFNLWSDIIQHRLHMSFLRAAGPNSTSSEGQDSHVSPPRSPGVPGVTAQCSGQVVQEQKGAPSQ